MAGMYLTWGGYSHDGSEVYYTRTRRPKYSRVGRREGYREVWSIRGDLRDTDTSALKVKISNLEAAYKDHGRDLIFRYEDGTATQDQLISSQTLNGTRVVDFSWLSGVTMGQGHFGSQTQHVYTRAFQIVIQGEILDPEINVVFFSHSVRYGTGGFDYVDMESIAGPPIRQVTKLQTAFPAVQVGMAIGLLSHPAPAAPMFGQAKPKASSVEYDYPLVLGANFSTYFCTKWKYIFTGVNALSGLPGGF
jgi:hypothetical protein